MSPNWNQILEKKVIRVKNKIKGITRSQMVLVAHKVFKNRNLIEGQKRPLA